MPLYGMPLLRFIWEVEKADQKDTEEAINTALKWCDEKCNALLRFSVELCDLYFNDHNAL